MSQKRSKATRQGEAGSTAARAAAIRQEQEAKERRRRNLVVGAVVLVVIALIAAIAIAVQASRDTTGESSGAPSNAVDTYALAIGKSDAPVDVTVYEDLMCPFCGQFEAGSRDMLQKYVASGDVTVKYHVISILDRASSTSYSTRAANAVAVVLDSAGPEVAKKFHDLLYENQPEEGSAGLTDAQLVEYAVQAGADKSKISDGIGSLEFKQWVVNATDYASKKGYDKTPTVLLDGKQVEGGTIAEVVGNLQQGIESAR